MKELEMKKLVISADQIREMIEEYQLEVDANTELQDRMAYARSWLAVKDDDGKWIFGPAKFVAYQDLDAVSYLAGRSLDGRKADKQARLWFKELDTNHPLFVDLYVELLSFLGQYEKNPSGAARISIPAELYDGDAHVLEDRVADLIVAVARLLPNATIKRVRASL